MKKNGFSFSKMIVLIGILIAVFLIFVGLYKKNNPLDNSNDKDTSVQDSQLGDTSKKIYMSLENSMLESAQIYITLYGDSTVETVISHIDLQEKNLISPLKDPMNSEQTCNGYVIYNGVGEYQVYLNCPDNYISENYNKDFAVK